MDLKDLVDKLGGKTSTERKNALKDLVGQLYQDDTKHAQTLTKHSMWVRAGKELRNKYDWADVVEKAREAVDKESKRSARGGMDLWRYFDQLVDLAERQGHYLHSIIRKLCDCVFTVLESPSDTADKVRPVASQLLSRILDAKVYYNAIGRTMYTELVSFYSQVFLHSISKEEQKKNAHRTLASNNSMLCAQIYAALVGNYPYQTPALFAKDCVVPFYRTYLNVERPPPNSSTTVVLFSGLNSFLELHVMDCLTPLPPLVHSLTEFIASCWRTFQPKMKIEVTQFYLILFRITCHLPSTAPLGAMGQFFANDEHVYNAVLSEMSSLTLFTWSALSQSQLASDVFRILALDTHTYNFLHFASHVVHCTHANSAKRALSSINVASGAANNASGDGVLSPRKKTKYSSSSSISSLPLYGGSQHSSQLSQMDRKRSLQDRFWAHLCARETEEEGAICWMQFVAVYLYHYPSALASNDDGTRRNGADVVKARISMLLHNFLGRLRKTSSKLHHPLWVLAAISSLTTAYATLCPGQRVESFNRLFTTLIKSFVYIRVPAVARVSIYLLSLLLRFDLVTSERLTVVPEVISQLFASLTISSPASMQDDVAATAAAAGPGHSVSQSTLYSTQTQHDHLALPLQMLVTAYLQRHPVNIICENSYFFKHLNVVSQATLRQQQLQQQQQLHGNDAFVGGEGDKSVPSFGLFVWLFSQESYSPLSTALSHMDVFDLTEHCLDTILFVLAYEPCRTDLAFQDHNATVVDHVAIRRRATPTTSDMFRDLIVRFPSQYDPDARQSTNWFTKWSINLQFQSQLQQQKITSFYNRDFVHEPQLSTAVNVSRLQCAQTSAINDPASRNRETFTLLLREEIKILHVRVVDKLTTARVPESDCTRLFQYFHIVSKLYEVAVREEKEQATSISGLSEGKDVKADFVLSMINIVHEILTILAVSVLPKLRTKKGHIYLTNSHVLDYFYHTLQCYSDPYLNDGAPGVSDHDRLNVRMALKSVSDQIVLLLTSILQQKLDSYSVKETKTTRMDVFGGYDDEVAGDVNLSLTVGSLVYTLCPVMISILKHVLAELQIGIDKKLSKPLRMLTVQEDATDAKRGGHGLTVDAISRIRFVDWLLEQRLFFSVRFLLSLNAKMLDRGNKFLVYWVQESIDLLSLEHAAADPVLPHSVLWFLYEVCIAVQEGHINRKIGLSSNKNKMQDEEDSDDDDDDRLSETEEQLEKYFQEAVGLFGRGQPCFKRMTVTTKVMLHHFALAAMSAQLHGNVRSWPQLIARGISDPHMPVRAAFTRTSAVFVNTYQIDIQMKPVAGIESVVYKDLLDPRLLSDHLFDEGEWLSRLLIIVHIGSAFPQFESRAVLMLAKLRALLGHGNARQDKHAPAITDYIDHMYCLLSRELQCAVPRQAADDTWEVEPTKASEKLAVSAKRPNLLSQHIHFMLLEWFNPAQRADKKLIDKLKLQSFPFMWLDSVKHEAERTALEFVPIQDMVEFITHYQHRVFPILLLAGTTTIDSYGNYITMLSNAMDQERVKELTLVCKIGSAKKMFVQWFSEVYAISFVLGKVDSKAQGSRYALLYATVSQNLPTDPADNDVYGTLIDVHVNEIMLRLADLAMGKSSELLPSFDLNDILPDLLVHHTEESRRVQTMELILHFRMQFVEYARQDDKQRLWFIFSKFLDRFLEPADIQNASVFRQAIKFLLWLVADQSAAFLRRQVLLKLCWFVNQAVAVEGNVDVNDKVSALALYASEILNTLFRSYEREAAVDMIDEVNDELVDEHNAVLSQSVKSCKTLVEWCLTKPVSVLATLPPFPTAQDFAGVAQQVNTATESLTLSDYIAVFISFSYSCDLVELSSSTVDMLISNLRKLLQHLQSRKPELVGLLQQACDHARVHTAMLNDVTLSREAKHAADALDEKNELKMERKSSGNGSAETAAKKAELVSSLLLQLIKLCRHMDATVKELAGICIGEVGVVDPSLLARSESRTHSLYAQYVRIDEAPPEHLHYYFMTGEHHAFIIELLDHHMSDADVHVVALACAGMYDLCNGEEWTQIVTEALTFVDLKIADAFIEVFDYTEEGRRMQRRYFHTLGMDSHRNSYDKMTVDFANTSLKEVFEPRKSTSFEEWVCNVTSFLIVRYGHDQLLKKCAHLCHLRSQFALVLLPFVVFDVIFRSDMRPNGKQDELCSTRAQELAKLFNRLVQRQTRRLAPRDAMDVGDEKESNVKLKGRPESFLSAVLSVYRYVNDQYLYFMRMNPKDRDEGKRVLYRSVHYSFKVLHEKFIGGLCFLDLAHAAMRCTSYFTGLHLLEAWHTQRYGHLNALHAHTTGERDHEDTKHCSCYHSSEAAMHERFLQLLSDLATHISGPDDLYGVIACRSDSESSLMTDMMLAEHEGSWSKLLPLCDTVSSASQSARLLTENRLVNALQHLGCTKTVHRYMQDIHRNNKPLYEELSAHHFEAAWRRCQWDVLPPAQDDLGEAAVRDGNSSDGAFVTDVQIHGCLYRSMKELQVCLQERNDNNSNNMMPTVTRFHKYIRRALVRSLSGLQQVDYVESRARISTFIVQLQLLCDLEKLCDHIFMKGSQSSSATSMNDGTWTKQIMLSQNHFNLVEPLLALRVRLLEIGQDNQYLFDTFQLAVGMSRQLNDWNNCAQTLRHGLQSDSLTTLQKLALNVETGRLHWNEGNTDKAIRSLRNVVQGLNRLGPIDAKTAESASLAVEANCLLAEWMSRSYGESRAVIQEILVRAELIANQNASDVDRSKVHYFFARFMDRVYQDVYTKRQSTEYAKRQRKYDKNKAELKALRALAKEHKQENTRGLLRQLEKNIVADEKEFASLEQNVLLSREKAIVHYFECLRHGDRYNVIVLYRALSLWFGEKVVSLENKSLHLYLDHVPTRKFIPLLYQLAARLSLVPSNGNDHYMGFNETIYRLMYRITTEYPFHALWKVFALCNTQTRSSTTKLKKSSSRSRSRSNSTATPALKAARQEAATRMIAELKQDKQLGVVVASMEKLMDAYIALAKTKLPDIKLKPKFKTNTTQLGKLPAKILAMCPVMTDTVQVTEHLVSSPDKFVRVSSFMPEIQVSPSGIHNPLIVQLIGTDGQRYKQLLKKDDDLRQDGVMEQLFTLMNGLLTQSAETRKRKLCMRTYNVIPLTPEIGVIEWVLGTSSFFEILADPKNNPLHERYPTVVPKSSSKKKIKRQKSNGAMDDDDDDDYGLGEKMGYYDCSRLMKYGLEKEPESLPRRYAAIAKRWMPVFHRWFVEKWGSPVEWYDKRLNYSRSLAVSSMIGYVVGLGDRHMSNMLIDKETADVVHIDLGVAFEAGKALRTPEVVPFRLTRDLVDGLGISGVEGVFRRCAEQTVKVMRANEEMLLTILEAFVHDPLFAWNLTAEQIERLQANKLVQDTKDAKAAAEYVPAVQAQSVFDEGDEKGNESAQRAIFRVKEKLRGSERSSGEVLSVSGQVNALIREATDPDNLSRLFYGWGAWC